MTTYTWKRGRGGTSGDSSADTILATKLAQYAPGAATTVRRSIVDWGIDLYAIDDTGGVNTQAPITLGLIGLQSDTDDPTAPDFGPADNPSLGWWWYGGVWYSNNYDFSAGSGPSGAMSANGRIDVTVNHALIDTLYTTIWLISEITDPSGLWTKLIQETWWSFLSDPTGS